MQKQNGTLLFSPSDLVTFINSEFDAFMERWRAEDPKHCPEHDPEDEGKRIIAQHGDRHEAKYLEELKKERRVCEIPTDDVAVARRLTLEAMKRGEEAIYQGVLSCGPFEGRTDFLIKRTDHASNFGAWYYEVWDTKLARHTKPYFIIQLCCYAEMLLEVQGYLPPEFCVVLGTNEREARKTADFLYIYRQVKRAFLQFHDAFDLKNPPKYIQPSQYSRWNNYAKKLIEERDCVSQVANIRRLQMRKLEKHGIVSMRALANTTEARIFKMAPETFATLKRQARLQVESFQKDVPSYEVIPHETGGLFDLPPHSVNDVFFDMEGYPLIEDGLEYLFGATYLDNGELQFKDWWAHDRAQEKRAFEGFIDWVYARWKADPTMHIYHYAAYEVSAMRRLMTRHATRETEVDDMLRNNVFVDLFSVVRHSLCVGEPKYSIKNLEHIYAGKRHGDVATAADSIVFYEHWLDNKDGETYEDSLTLQNIRDYNKEDCDSTYKLTKWLRKLQSDNNFVFRGKLLNEEAPKDIPDNPAAQLADRLLTNIPADVANDPERVRIHQLLAHVLEFHRREMKCVYWKKFDRMAMTYDELHDDIDCLAGLKRTSKSAEKATKRTKNLSYEYSFDPEQQTKLRAGSKCFIVPGGRKADIVEFDLKTGLLSIKAKDAPEEFISLIPDETVPLEPLVSSILRTVTRYAESNRVERPLKDFLLRRPPKVIGVAKGANLLPSNYGVSDACSVVERLDNSVLCIQGPPGCGKTYTGARMILHLLGKGKRVGITSNSHAAIGNLMIEVMKAAEEANVRFSAAKADSKDELDPRLAAFGVAHIDNKDAFSGGTKYQLVGGTAYCFSRDDAIGAVDYLFVDEAGQVAVANIIAMSPCAKNMILLGDQMQLEQPVQGQHPGESGQSALQYLVGETKTIQPDFGIFLGITHRMHPHVCKLISEAVYEDRLTSADIANERTLVLPDVGLSHVTKPTGILFSPVQHEGCTQGSEEEAERVKHIIDELRKCFIIRDKGKAAEPIKNDDILVVAPYNHQVKLIAERCPEIRVGSVDKFQGQEAPVLILSMCASDIAGSPRGVEFLFDRNRLNVAISRAQCLAIVVANPKVAAAPCTSVKQMELANFFCRIVEEGSHG